MTGLGETSQRLGAAETTSTRYYYHGHNEDPAIGAAGLKVVENVFLASQRHVTLQPGSVPTRPCTPIYRRDQCRLIVAAGCCDRSLAGIGHAPGIAAFAVKARIAQGFRNLPNPIGHDRPVIRDILEELCWAAEKVLACR